MNDRELLELAARAAGFKPTSYCDEEGLFLNDQNPDYGFDWWNPLTDDGDALRLAVKLDIHISLYGKDTGITTWIVREEAESFHADYGDDPCCSVRRAIVRAAAEIGGNMP